MARALQDILTELNSVYNPQRSSANNLYSQNMAAVDPQQQADLTGLEAAKKDSFGQIETGANRRGMFYSGVPVAEQSKYVGQSYLPAVANLQNRYAQIRGNLRQSLSDTLANLDIKQNEYGQNIHQQELTRDEQTRQFNAQLAATERANAANAPFKLGGGGDGDNSTDGKIKEPPADIIGLQNMFNRNYQSTAGTVATRANQLNWINSWAAQQGYDPNNINGVNSQWILDNYFPAAQYVQRPPTLSPNIARPQPKAQSDPLNQLQYIARPTTNLPF